MPFALIPTALGVCFFLVWAFIGGMILRDGHHEVDSDRESDDQAWSTKPPRRKAA